MRIKRFIIILWVLRLHTSTCKRRWNCANETIAKYISAIRKRTILAMTWAPKSSNFCHLPKSQSQSKCAMCVRVRVLRVWQQFLHVLFFSFFLELCHFFFFPFLSLSIKCSFFFSGAKKRKIDFGWNTRLLFLSSSHLLHFYISDAQSTHHHC